MSKSERIGLITIIFIVFSSEIFFGIWLAHDLHFIPGDALSRVANAYFVLYSRQPHLAAIGFVWNPLPSLLALPLLLFKPWLPELATEGISGTLVTAFFAAASAGLFMRSMLHRKQGLFLSAVFVLLIISHPFLFLYGANGMSESVFIFFIIACVTFFLDWCGAKRVVSLVLVGFALALAFFTRYETIAFGAALACSFALIIITRRREYEDGELQTIRSTYQRLEATELIVLLPVVYGVLIWLFLNWSIMGDAFYFLRSSYSNLAQSEGLSKNPLIGAVIGHPERALVYVIARSLPFSCPAAAVLLIRALRQRFITVKTLSFLLLILSIPLMQWLMLVKGTSYGWLRFFAYPLPIAAAWLPFELQNLKQSGKRLYYAGVGIAVCALIISSVLTFRALQNGNLAPEEYQLFHYKDSYTYENAILAKEIANDLDQRLRERPFASVLMDSFNAFPIIVRMESRTQMIITSDLDFKAALRDPAHSRVRYILVPKPDGIARLNAVNQRYPRLYNNGSTFTHLVKQYGDQWRLYQVERVK